MTPDEAQEHLRDVISGLIAQAELGRDYLEDLDSLHRKALGFDRIAAIVAEERIEGRIAKVVQEVIQGKAVA